MSFVLLTNCSQGGSSCALRSEWWCGTCSNNKNALAATIDMPLFLSTCFILNIAIIGALSAVQFVRNICPR